MNKNLHCVVLCLLILICRETFAQNHLEKIILPDDYQKHFDKYEVNGSFVVHDLKNNKAWFYNEERTQTRFTPASTFKILSADG